MRSRSVEADQVVKCLLPANNHDPIDRAHAWNEWVLSGGAEPVRRFIRWTNGTSTEDDEIMQETLVLAYQKVEGGQYEDRNVPFTAFLKKIAWYKIMEASRQGASEVSLEDLLELPADEQRDHERVEFWKEHEALSHALTELPARRAHIVLLYENGYSTAEIAQLLAIREDLVRKEKSLGLRQLRQQIQFPLAMAS
jgi:RNA polymerase sigma factor (sigma-70 family)